MTGPPFTLPDEDGRVGG